MMTNDSGQAVDLEHDSETGVYRGSFAPDLSDPSTVVVLAVSEALDRDPSDLEKLNHCLDPDCLDKLFEPRTDGSARGGGEVVFPYAGFEVTVTSDGVVVLDPEPGES